MDGAGVNKKMRQMETRFDLPTFPSVFFFQCRTKQQEESFYYYWQLSFTTEM